LVRLRRIRSQVELSITDTGVGMAPEKLARCFEEYWSDKPGGTGLGLPTARRIIEEHGGTITAIAEEGRGSSFAILLPLAVELVRGEDGAREHEVEA
jgi:signal transduction histidine kinase